MNKEMKQVCKKMIRQALYAINYYDKYNVITHAEKRLAWDCMEAVLDFLPNVSDFRRHEIREYCDKIMSRLLEI